MTLSEKQTQSSFYSAREYLIPGLFFTFFSIRIGILPFFPPLLSLRLQSPACAWPCCF